MEISSEAADATDTWTDPVPLTIRQQKEFASVLAQGGSPAAACGKLKVPVENAVLSFETDARFRKRLELIYQSLTENVRAALYREAMKGSVTAQTHWLKDDAAQHSADRPCPEGDATNRVADLERIMKVLRDNGSIEAGR
jgi:hypothetical protein